MSLRTTIGIAILAVLGCVVGTFYYLRAREAKPAPEVVSPEPAGFRDAPPDSAKPANTAAAKPRLPAVSKKIAAPVDTALPLRAGEVFEYTANVSNLENVASLKLQVAGRGTFLGKSVWHLQAFAHTQNALRMIFEVDDQFDSYSDAATLTSLQYEMRLNERGQKVESLQRMTATGREPASPEAAQARVLPGTRDPLGLMQYLRNVDWAKTPEVRCPVYDGHKLYEVRAKLRAAPEKVTVPAGDYSASKIGIRVFENGVETKDASFILYLAINAARTPVLLEAVMPFATARVELLKAN